MVSENGGKDLSVPALLDVVRRRKLFVFIPALLVTMAVAGYTYYRPVLYKAQTLMGVESSCRDLIQPDGLPMRVQDQLLTIREVLLSREVLDPVNASYRLYPTNGVKRSDPELQRRR